MNAISRRRLMGGGLAAGVLTGLAAAGCANKAPEPGQGAPLIWWDREGEPAAGEVKKALAAYAKEKGVEVTRTAFGGSDEMIKAVIQGAASGTLPNVYLIDQQSTQTFAAQDICADLTDLLAKEGSASQFYDGAMESAKFNDKVYAVPFQATTTGLFYNADMLDKAGLSEPPATWDELREFAKKLTTSEHSGFSFSANNDGNGGFTFLPFLWQSGSSPATVGDAGSIATLEFYNNLINVDKSVSKNVLTLNQGDVSDQFLAGKCAMMINGSWNLTSYKADPPKFTWAVAPWPKGVEEASVLGGTNLMASPADDMTPVWDLLSWMSDPANSEAISEAAPLPARKDALAGAFWKELPGATVFADQILPVARSSALGPHLLEIYAALIEMYQQVLIKGMSPAEAAQQAGEKIKPLL